MSRKAALPSFPFFGAWRWTSSDKQWWPFNWISCWQPQRHKERRRVLRMSMQAIVNRCERCESWNLNYVANCRCRRWATTRSPGHLSESPHLSSPLQSNSWSTDVQPPYRPNEAGEWCLYTFSYWKRKTSGEASCLDLNPRCNLRVSTNSSKPPPSWDMLPWKDLKAECSPWVVERQRVPVENLWQDVLAGHEHYDFQIAALPISTERKPRLRQLERLPQPLHVLATKPAGVRIRRKVLFKKCWVLFGLLGSVGLQKTRPLKYQANKVLVARESGLLRSRLG